MNGSSVPAARLPVVYPCPVGDLDSPVVSEADIKFALGREPYRAKDIAKLINDLIAAALLAERKR